MLACLVSFANEYHVFHCHAVIKKNSYGLVIISRYGVLKTVRTRGPYMHMCICACAHCFHATATNPPWHCAINWRFSSWLSRIFGEIMDPCRHILSTMWTLDTYNVYLYKKTQLPQLRTTKELFSGDGHEKARWRETWVHLATNWNMQSQVVC